MLLAHDLPTGLQMKVLLTYTTTEVGSAKGLESGFFPREKPPGLLNGYTLAWRSRTYQKSML